MDKLLPENLYVYVNINTALWHETWKSLFNQYFLFLQDVSV